MIYQRRVELTLLWHVSGDNELAKAAIGHMINCLAFGVAKHLFITHDILYSQLIFSIQS